MSNLWRIEGETNGKYVEALSSEREMRKGLVHSWMDGGDLATSAATKYHRLKLLEGNSSNPILYKMHCFFFLYLYPSLHLLPYSLRKPKSPNTMQSGDVRLNPPSSKHPEPVQEFAKSGIQVRVAQ